MFSSCKRQNKNKWKNGSNLCRYRHISILSYNNIFLYRLHQLSWFLSFLKKLYVLILERKQRETQRGSREREREKKERKKERKKEKRKKEIKKKKERSTYCFTYSCIHWLTIACALTGDWTHNLGVPGRRSNQLSYPAWAFLVSLDTNGYLGGRQLFFCWPLSRMSSWINPLVYNYLLPFSPVSSLFLSWGNSLFWSLLFSVLPFSHSVLCLSSLSFLLSLLCLPLPDTVNLTLCFGFSKLI